MSKLHQNFFSSVASPAVNHASRHHQLLQIMILGHFAADCLMYKCPFGKRDGTLEKWKSKPCIKCIKGIYLYRIGPREKKYHFRLKLNTEWTLMFSLRSF